jgi:hypothetical protein
MTYERYKVVFGDGHERGAQTVTDARRIARNAIADGDPDVSIMDTYENAAIPIDPRAAEGPPPGTWEQASATTAVLVAPDGTPLYVGTTRRDRDAAIDEASDFLGYEVRIPRNRRWFLVGDRYEIRVEPAPAARRAPVPEARMAAERPAIHEFSSTGSAYDATQTELDDGEVLLVRDEGVVGVSDTWPIAVTEAHGELHRMASGYTVEQWASASGSKDSARLIAGHRAAVELAKKLGYPLRGVGPAGAAERSGPAFVPPVSSLAKPFDDRAFLIDLWWRLGSKGRENLHGFASSLYTGGEKADFAWWDTDDPRFYSDVVGEIIERRGANLPHWAADEALAHWQRMRGRAP